MTKPDSEWDQRRLCSDGNCIGIVGADGLCKVCGTPYDGVLPDQWGDSQVADDDLNDPPDDRQTGEPADQQIIGADDPAEDETTTILEASDPAWEERTLCVDGNCIGVVGPDGRCKECGKPYPG